MTVELFGIARSIAGTPQIDVAVDEPATLGALVRALARACPALVGDVIEASGDGFVAPNYVLLDGRRAAGMDEPVRASDKPCVLFLASGG